MWATAFRLKQLLVTSAALANSGDLRELHYDVYRKVLDVVEEGRAEVGGREHSDGFRRYAELTDAIERGCWRTRGV
jgi:hypothetical protein